MGLDMFLFGELPGGVQPAIELGYWRKHPNLHGWFVQQYGGGVDECQKIPLTRKQLQETLAASEEYRLPETDGFFFGQSMPEDKPATAKILTSAICWLRNRPKAKVYYQASW